MKILLREKVQCRADEQSFLGRDCVLEAYDLDDPLQLEDVGDVVVVVDIVELGFVLGRDLERDHHAKRRRANIFICHERPYHIVMSAHDAPNAPTGARARLRCEAR